MAQTTRVKNFLLPLLAVVVGVIFIAPWYQTPHARENIFEHNQRTFNLKMTKDGKIACSCDGSCIYMDSHWAPFGLIIKDCSYDYYYKIFWGKEFHVKSKIKSVKKL